MAQTTKYIWFNGELVEWDKAQVHVMTHALHYGSSVFEGIRAYDTPNGPIIFRLKEHIQRLFDSAKIYWMEMPFTPEQLCEACRVTVPHHSQQPFDHFRARTGRDSELMLFHGLASNMCSFAAPGGTRGQTLSSADMDTCSR